MTSISNDTSCLVKYHNNSDNDFDSNCESNNSNNSGNNVISFIEEALRCPICFSLLSEPITLLCGHTFCKVCYDVTVFRTTQECAMCRAKPVVKSQVIKPNAVLIGLTTKYFPDLSIERKKECDKVRYDLEHTAPVFCLQYALLPGIYRYMIIFYPYIYIYIIILI